MSKKVAAVVLFVFITAGCYPTNFPTRIPINLETKETHIRGRIKSIYLSDNKISGISIDGVLEADTVYAKAMVGITDETRVLFKTDSEFSDTVASSLKEDQIVEVLFTGPIQTSDPIQANALEITILKSQAADKPPIRTTIETFPDILPAATKPVTPTLPLPARDPTAKPTTIPFIRVPVIHDMSGEIYETLFSLPVGPNNIIQYKVYPSQIEGPNAIAVLPDDTFLISDLNVGRRLLNYDQEGQLLQTIELDELGIGYARDLRVKENEIFLLETGYQKLRVHRLTLAGKLIASEEIPYWFSSDTQNSENSLEGRLTGIVIDCEGRIILELYGGFRLFPLSEVQQQSDPGLIAQGVLCNDKRFFVSTPGLWKNPQITAGGVTYQTQLTQGLGGLNILDVFQDGGFYLVREDLMPTTVVKVDQTIHYIDENGVVQGVARVPLSEFYYPIMRNTAVNSNGEVIALLPRPDSLDIIRLNFYQELEPLMPGAVAPQISTNLSNP